MLFPAVLSEQFFFFLKTKNEKKVIYLFIIYSFEKFLELCFF